MKKCFLISILLASTVVNAHQVDTTSKHYKFVGDQAYKNFCKAVTEDNVLLLKRSFADKVGLIAMNEKEAMQVLMNRHNLSCNGKGILEFSREQEADDVVAYLEAKRQRL